MSIMYFLATMFFGGFIYLSKINVYRVLKYSTIKTKNKIINKTSKK
jgi:NADH:ubiquinone oxidoreductase subunit 2 (subunit N)